MTNRIELSLKPAPQRERRRDRIQLPDSIALELQPDPGKQPCQPKEWPYMFPSLKKSMGGEFYLRNHVQNDQFIEKFTPDNLRKLQRVNALLVQAVKKLLRERREVIAELRRAKARLTDYELNYILGFYLNERDPAYLEENDNQIAEFELNMRRLEFYRTPDPEDWRAGLTGPGAPLAGQKFCSLLYELLERAYVPWEDIVRIGSCWAEIHIRQQYCYKLKRNRFVRRPWCGEIKRTALVYPRQTRKRHK